MTATWPKDTQDARNAFYGDPGRGQIPSQMVPVTPPFKMFYEGTPVKVIQFHKKAAPALLAALNEMWDYCQHDQARIDAAGVSKYAGAYNHRMVRGSSTKWSNHAYAAAIDLNAEDNGLYAKGNMPQFVIDAFCRQGWMWGGWYTGRKDPMHFEAVDNGGRKPTTARPVFGSAVSDDPPVPAPEDHAPIFPTLRKGSSGEYVKLLQSKLGVDSDGDFGNKTAEKLKAFQTAHHLVADSICGPQTWNALNAQVA